MMVFSNRYAFAAVVAPVAWRRSAFQVRTWPGRMLLTGISPKAGRTCSRSRRRYSSSVVGISPRSSIHFAA